MSHQSNYNLRQTTLFEVSGYGKADSATQEFLLGQYDTGSVLGAVREFIHGLARSGKARKTLRHHLDSLQPLGKHLKDTPLASVTSEQIRIYGDILALRYATGGRKSIIGDIRQFFRYCHTERLTDTFLAKDLKKPTTNRKRSRKRARALLKKSAPEAESKHVLRSLSARLKEKGLIFRNVFKQLDYAPAEQWKYGDLKILRDLFIILFIYESGARIGGVSTLSRREMVTETGEKQDLYTVETFEKQRWEERDFTEATAEIFRVWDAVRPKACLDHAVLGWGHGHPHRPMSPDSVSVAVAKRWRECGFKERRGHSLRHSKVRRLKRVASPEVASFTIGHSDPRVTKDYGTEDELADLELASAASMFDGDLWS